MYPLSNPCFPFALSDLLLSKSVILSPVTPSLSPFTLSSLNSLQCAIPQCHLPHPNFSRFSTQHFYIFQCFPYSCSYLLANWSNSQKMWPFGQISPRFAEMITMQWFISLFDILCCVFARTFPAYHYLIYSVRVVCFWCICKCIPRNSRKLANCNNS